MTTYHAQHADLFREVADILARDYIAPSETAETVAEWSQSNYWRPLNIDNVYSEGLAKLIAYVEGYERRKG